MAYQGSARSGADAPPARIAAWSASRVKLWLQCPFKLKCGALLKLKEPESAAQLEGKRIHKLAEDYLNRKLIDVPPELMKFKDDVVALRDCGPDLKVELALTFREDLSLTGWFAKDAWLRVRFDALVLNDDGTAVVVDWKTGKPYPEDAEQCELYTVALLIAYPELREVTTELWYTPTGHVPTPSTLTREQLPKLREKWFGLAERVLADEEFLPIPNKFCGYCHYRASNGGPCKFS